MFDWLVFSLTYIFASAANVELYVKCISVYKNIVSSTSTRTIIAEGEIFC